jgi:hypothetical protein
MPVCVGLGVCVCVGGWWVDVWVGARVCVSVFGHFGVGGGLVNVRVGVWVRVRRCGVVLVMVVHA